MPKVSCLGTFKSRHFAPSLDLVGSKSRLGLEDFGRDSSSDLRGQRLLRARIVEKIIEKDTNCNVNGIQPCSSMFQKSPFDGFAHQCLVLLIER